MSSFPYAAFCGPASYELGMVSYPTPAAVGCFVRAITKPPLAWEALRPSPEPVQDVPLPGLLKFLVKATAS